MLKKDQNELRKEFEKFLFSEDGRTIYARRNRSADYFVQCANIRSERLLLTAFIIFLSDKKEVF